MTRRQETPFLISVVVSHIFQSGSRSICLETTAILLTIMRFPDSIASVNEELQNGYNEVSHPTASTVSNGVII
jgi:hypothetical protein